MRQTWDFLLDRSPEQLIAAGLAALALALAAAALHALARRNLHDSFLITTATAFLACLLAMIAAAGFAAQVTGDQVGAAYSFDHPPPGGFGPGLTWGPRILQAADVGRDVRLSPQEAADAAARFVRE